MKNEQAKERQRKRRRRLTHDQKVESNLKAKERMQKLRKLRKMMKQKSQRRFLSHRKRVLRRLKACGCNFIESGKIDVIQHNFLCYEKSLAWFECDICNERVLTSSLKRFKCSHDCHLLSDDNNMDPMSVPPELLGLTYIEKQLIARVHSIFSVYKVEKGQYHYKGHVINFPQNVQYVADTLPHVVCDLNNLVVVKLQTDIDMKDFYVRKQKVLDSLIWLKENNPLYFDIAIDLERIDTLPDNGNVYKDLKVMTQQNIESDTIEDHDEEGDIVNTSGVPDGKESSLNNTLNSLIWPTIGRSPINEFGSPGYMTLCFPHLFPYAEGDISMPRAVKVPLPLYVQHLMKYKDGRFAKDERFRYFIMNSQMRWSALNIGNLYVQKNNFFSKMSVIQLKEYLLHNKGMVKQIMYYASRIRTTKSYWNSRCGELLDMVQQVGNPTVFFTLSAADYHWPHLFRLLGKDVRSLTFQERAKLISENPFVADTYFYLRSKFFIDHCFKEHFNVSDIWYRYEFQHRGSVHLHGLAWLKDAPNLKNCVTEEDRKKMLQYFETLISAENPDINLIPSSTHPCQITLEQVDDLDTDLAQLCNHVQRHTKCKKGFCLRKVNNTWTCKYKFPKDLCDEAYFEIENDVIKDVCFKRNDPLLNKFNQWILQTWRANIDFSPIFSKEIVYRYIAKYASKSEIKSQPYNEIMSEILQTKCSDNENCKQAIRKMLLTSCAERDYCAQEVVHFLMGYHFYAKSRDFVIVNIMNKDWVSISEGYSSNSVIDNYIVRSSQLEHFSIFEVSKFYYVKQGIHCLRRRPAIVRFFPRLKKEFNEKAYYECMSQIFYPWRHIEDVEVIDEIIKGHVDYSINLFVTESCEITDSQEYLPPNETKSLKGNEQILSEYNPNKTTKNLGYRTIDEEYNWDRHSGKIDVENIQTVYDYLRKDVDRLVCGEKPVISLNEEQKKFLTFIEDKVEESFASEEQESFFCFVQGMPGTGKSHLLKACVRSITERLGSNSLKVLAPTGVAAKNVDGITLHSFLMLGKFGFNMKSLTGVDLLNYKNKYSDLKFIFVDESSMVGLRMLSCLERRCREIKDSDKMFGGINVILIGDCNQLQPVGDQRLYADPSSLSQSNSLLERGMLIMSSITHAYVLKQCHRFGSKDYISFLKRVSKGKCNLSDLRSINQRIISHPNVESDKQFSNSLKVCSLNETANHYNLFECEKLRKPIAVIHAKNNNKTAFSTSDDIADGLTNVLFLCEGAKVMLRRNLNVSRGLVNGAIGIVKCLIYERGKKPPSLPLCVLVSFQDVDVGDLGINSVPIMPLVAMWYRNGVNCSRYQLPLSLAWACTIHKAQGLTLLSMILDIGSAEFALGLLYVALSRVSDKKNLCLVTSLTLARLNSVKNTDSYFLNLIEQCI